MAGHDSNMQCIRDGHALVARMRGEASVDATACPRENRSRS
jgi:hypothetical protein